MKDESTLIMKMNTAAGYGFDLVLFISFHVCFVGGRNFNFPKQQFQKLIVQLRHVHSIICFKNLYFGQRARAFVEKFSSETYR